MAGTINQSSANSLVQKAGNGVPNDGTGECSGNHQVMDFSGANISKGIVQLDPYLEPFEETLKRRYAKAQQWIDSINKTEGGFDKFSKVSKAMGKLYAPC